MIDIETLLSPYGPTAKSLGEELSVVDSVAPVEGPGELFDTITLEPAALPRVAVGKHRAEVPIDSVTPTTEAMPIQLGRLSA